MFATEGFRVAPLLYTGKKVKLKNALQLLLHIGARCPGHLRKSVGTIQACHYEANKWPPAWGNSRTPQAMSEAAMPMEKDVFK